MQLDSEALRTRFVEFRHTAFRLETRQTYAMSGETENFARFLRGEPQPTDYDHHEWRRFVREAVASGKIIRRAKIVKRPFTDYTRWLLAWGVPSNTKAGEDYRILDLTEREIDLPEQDFWLYDEDAVVLLNFNSDGTLRNRELVEGDVSQYLRWRDLALENAVPFREYRP